MTVDTKGFVLTDCKDVMFVCKRIEKALNALLAPGLREHRFERFAANPKQEHIFRNCDLDLNASSGSVAFRFTDAGVVRSLTVNFECDCDQKDYGPSSISMSMGAHGRSGEYIQAALKSIAMLGPVYYRETDGDDVKPEVLDVTPPTYVSACADGSEYGSSVSMAKWLELYERGLMRKGTAEEVLGVSSGQAFQVLSADYERSEQLVDEFVEAFKQSMAEPATA